MGVARARVASPYQWGVVSMDLDTEALAAGELKVLEFLGVLPEGMLVAFEAGQPEAPTARRVEDALATNRTLDVYVAVPRDLGNGQGLTEAPVDAALTRFSMVTREVPDQNAGASLVPVAFAQPKVRLLVGDEPREDFECIKVAELARDASGGLGLVPEYVAPCLRIDAAPFILDGLRKLLRSVVAKQRELAGARRFRDASAVEFTASDVTKFLQLSTLNGHMPVLQHLVDQPSSSPHEVYLFLLGVAGQLSTFQGTDDPATLPRFNFTALRSTFEELFNRINTMLRSVAIAPALPIALERRAKGMYLGFLTDERFSRCAYVLLAVRSEVAEQQVVNDVPRLTKIASREEITNLLKAATPGVPLKVTFRPPAQIPVRPGVVYFYLSLKDPFWKKAVAEQNIAVYLPAPFDTEQTQVELLAIPHSPQQTPPPGAR
jgi:type VI secretion system protein ImpJ